MWVSLGIDQFPPCCPSFCTIYFLFHLECRGCSHFLSPSCTLVSISGVRIQTLEFSRVYLHREYICHLICWSQPAHSLYIRVVANHVFFLFLTMVVKLGSIFLSVLTSLTFGKYMECGLWDTALRRLTTVSALLSEKFLFASIPNSGCITHSHPVTKKYQASPKNLYDRWLSKLDLH